MKSQLKGFGEVFSKFSYILMWIFFSLLFYMLTVIVSDFSEFKAILVDHGLFNKIIFYYFVGFSTTLTLFSSISAFLISMLFGSYVCMAIYKVKQINSIRERVSLFGSIGVFLGLFAPGCAACGLGLATLFGLGGFLVTLPLEGLEVSIIALILLGYANFNVAGKINKNSCALKFKKS